MKKSIQELRAEQAALAQFNASVPAWVQEALKALNVKIVAARERKSDGRV